MKDTQGGGHPGVGGQLGGKSNDFTFKGVCGVGSDGFDAGLGIAQTVQLGQVYVDLLLFQCGQRFWNCADGLAPVRKQVDASRLGRRKTESHR